VSTISDADLVAAVEHAYRDGYRRFLSLAVGMLGDVDGARDAVQEAFAHALRHRRDLREAESLNAWLWQIVVNVCRVEKRHPVTRNNRPPVHSPETPSVALRTRLGGCVERPTSRTQ
jgi:DNA-directed RNA polymerase specialized sigma24 family protein